MQVIDDKTMDKIVKFLDSLGGDLLGNLYYAIRKFYGDV